MEDLFEGCYRGSGIAEADLLIVHASDPGVEVDLSYQGGVVGGVFAPDV